MATIFISVRHPFGQLSQIGKRKIPIQPNRFLELLHRLTSPPASSYHRRPPPPRLASLASPTSSSPHLASPCLTRLTSSPAHLASSPAHLDAFRKQLDVQAAAEENEKALQRQNVKSMVGEDVPLDEPTSEEPEVEVAEIMGNHHISNIGGVPQEKEPEDRTEQSVFEAEFASCMGGKAELAFLL
ncbi:hypothetical protein ACLB2K_049357 [Fragaria x ananassa]